MLGACSQCREEVVRGQEVERQRRAAFLRSFPQYTTDVEGDYESLGVVSGIAVMGANIFRDFAASITDIVGGRSGQYEKAFAEGRDIALFEMCDEALSRGADLVAGIRVDFEQIRHGMMIVSASGTALKKRDSAGTGPQ